MAMQIIGRVAVKVIPDTKSFRQDAKTDVDKIEKQLPKIKVHATFDSTGLKSEMLKAIRALNAEIKTKDAYKIKFGATISQVGMDREVRKAQKELQALAKGGKQVKFDMAGAVGLTGVELDQNSLKRVQKELEHWRDKVSPLKIGVAPEIVNGTGAVVSARLAQITRPRTVDIIPKIDKPAAAAVLTTLAALSGGRVLNNVLDGIWSRLKRLDKAVPIIGTLALAVSGLAGYALTAGSNLFALSQSLAQIGPAVLTLPGIFAGIAIGVGATIAVVKDFNKVFPEMAGKVHDLQDAMSEKFWAKAEAPMRNFIDTLFPLFSKSIQQTSSELGGFFANFSTSLGDALGPILGSMFDDLNSSITIASKHTDAFANIITVLGQVGAGYLPQLAGWFGDISDKFSNFLTRTKNDGSLKGWIDQGIFQLQELGRAAGGIGSILGGIAKAANAAGGSSLTMMADTLQRVADVVNGPAFQTQLVAVLTAAHQAMSTISEKAGPAFSKFMSTLGSTLTTILPMVGNTIGTAFDAIFSALSQPEVVNGLTDMFSGIMTAVIMLAPAMAPLGKALGAIFSIIGPLAAVLGPVLAVAFTTLANVIFTLAPYIESLIGVLGGGLLSILTAIAPSVEGLGKVLGEAFTKLMPALKPVIEFIVQLASAVLPVLIDGIGQVITALGPLIEVLGQVFAVVGPLLIPVLKFLAEILVGAIVGAVEGVVGVIVGLVEVFTGLWNFFDDLFHGRWGQLWADVQQIFSGAWTAIVGFIKVIWNVGILGMFSKGFAILKGLFSGGWGAIVTLCKELWSSLVGRFNTLMSDLLSGTVSKLTAIKNFFKGAWGDIKAALSLAWEAMVNTVKSALSRFASAVSNGISKVLGFFRGIGGKVRSAVGNLGDVLTGAGQAIISGLINGIMAGFNALKGALGKVTSFIKDHKGPIEYDRVMLMPAGQAIMDGLIDGLESRYDAVRKSLKGITSDIAMTAVSAPTIGAVDTASLSSSVGAAIDASLSTEGPVVKQFNYYAAEGNSLDSEEDLFAAANRGRMVGW